MSKLKLILPVWAGTPEERLSCLLCRNPNVDDPDQSKPGCEYEVSFSVFGGVVTAGLHKSCYERAMRLVEGPWSAVGSGIILERSPKVASIVRKLTRDADEKEKP